ncbi:MAG: cytidine deaminase [Bacteroidales bacterium]
MKEIKINITIEEYDTVEELTNQERLLIQKANEACKKAYAPYSEFSVGASVLLGNGEVICGNNQENAAYPSGLCAERVALFYASSLYPNMEVVALAVVAKSSKVNFENPVSPCGACRQVMSEYELRQGKPFRILMQGNEGKIHAVESVDYLLPLQFKAEGLKK